MGNMTRLEWQRSIAERLQAIRAAKLDLIVNGKSVSIQGSHSYTKADLPDLLRMEAELSREVAAFYRLKQQRRTEIPVYE